MILRRSPCFPCGSRKRPTFVEIARDHYLYPLLRYEVNPLMSARRFKELMEVWLCLWGNAYAEIEMNGRSQVTGLLALAPGPRQSLPPAGPARGAPGLLYRYRMEDGSLYPTDGALTHEHVLHVRGLGSDGMLGLSPIELHKQTIALSLAVTEHGSRFFGNGARPLGILSLPSARMRLLSRLSGIRKQWCALGAGLVNHFFRGA